MQYNFSRIASHNTSRNGFTIVEVAVVIVIVAILATVVAFGYDQVEQNTIKTGMQSDIEAAASQLQTDKLKNGSYPADAASADGGAGLKLSGDSSFNYTLKPYGFCLAITNAATDEIYRVKNIDGKIANGNCDVVTTTYAGSGIQGTDNGSALSARFYRPKGMAIDKQGNVYVVDSGNHRVRKIAIDGTVSTFAGSTSGASEGIGTAAQFSSPNGIAIDNDLGVLYVADAGNHKIRKITIATQEVSTYAGTGTSGVVQGPVASARFTNPYGVTVDARNGDIYVAENSYRIRKISGGVVSTFAGAGVTGYVDGASTVARFAAVQALAVGPNGVVYVADAGNNRIRTINADGIVSTLAGSSTAGNVDGTGAAAQFNNPTGIAVDTTGIIYVSNTWGDTIRAVTPAGVVVTIAGATGGFANGIGTAALFNDPFGIAIDSSGTLYIGDYNNQRIRKLVP